MGGLRTSYPFLDVGVTLPAVDARDRDLKADARRRRLPYLATAAALALIASAPALAQTPRGGAGGSNSSGFNNGGLSSATGAGENGGDASNFTRGGGGGGAGVIVGNGGSGTGNTAGGAGFDSAGNGYDGENGSFVDSGGGGAGGLTRSVVTTDTTNSAAIAGGRGGRGGSTTGSNHAGGGGGAGGYGVVVDGSGLTYTNGSSGIISAGSGGAGGSNTLTDGYGGNGGDGGIGIQLTGNSVLINAGSIAGGSGGAGGNALNSQSKLAAGDGGNGSIGVYASGPATIINSGSITGGTSGDAGMDDNGPGITGAAGAAIVGANLAVVNSGTISRGLQTGGLLPVNAITFTGGSNVLELQAGSVITGNVVGTGTDTLRLGGANDSSFDVSSIGPTAQYQGFSSFVKTGASTWTLTGTTTAVTPWSINQGTLAVSSDASLGAASGALSFDGGTLRFLSGFTTSRVIALNGGGGSFDTNGNDATLAGDIFGSGGLTKLGLGTLVLTGATSYTGATNVNAGTLQAGAALAFSSRSAFTVAGGATLDLNGFDQTIGSLAGSGNVLLGTATLTAGVDNSSTVFFGTIAGSGGFTKSGTGTLQLAGLNGYGGATTVNAGTLQAGIAGAFSSSSAFTVSGGATLDLNGFDQTIGSLAGGGNVLLGTATLTAGGDNSSTVFSGSISGSGGFTKAGSGTMQLAGLNSYGGATHINGGTLQAGIAGAFASSSAFTVATGATLDLNGFNQSIGSLAGGGNVLLGTATLTAGGDNSSTVFSGSISGSGGFSKAGTGILQLAGINGYSGATSVNAGTLQAGLAGAFASSSAFTVANGATLDLNNFSQTIGSLAGGGNVLLGTATLTAGGDNSSTVFSGSISGGGGFTKAGTGTLQLAGLNIYGGATAINGGTLQAGIAGAFSSSSAFTVGSGATLDLNGFNQTIGSLAGSGDVLLGTATLTVGGKNTSTLFSGAISGSGGLTKVGTGTLQLGHANSYTGATIVSGGTLQAGVAGAFSSQSAFTIAAGATLDLHGLNATIGSLAGGGNVTLGSRTLTAGGDNSSTVFSGTISGTGGFTKAGSGTLQVSGTMGNAGATSVNGGTLQAGAAGAFSSASAFTVAGGATLDLNGFDQTIGSLAGGGTVLLGTATLTAGGHNGSTVYSGTISGSGGFTKAGTGTMQLTGVNSYAGATTINGGTLQAGIVGAFSSSSAFTVGSGATLDLNGFDQTIGSLAGGGNVLLGTATLTAGGDNSSTVFSGSISGSGGLAKTGTGTLRLTGVNSYGGATIVDGGVLDVEGSITNTSAVTVNAGGTLTGAGFVDPPLTIAINAGGTLAPGNGAAGSSMTIDGNLALQSGATYRVQLDPSTASFATVNGSASLGGATVNAVYGNGGYVNKTYTILTATGGVSGTFAALVNTNAPANFTPSLRYDAHDVFLDLAVHFGGNGPLDGNQRKVATTLDDFFNRNGGIPGVFFAVTPTGLTQASGELGTAPQQVTFDAMSRFMGLLTDPSTPRSSVADGTNGPIGFADAESVARRGTDAFAMVAKAPAGSFKAPAGSFAQRWNVWAAGFGGAQSTSGNAATGANDTTSRIYSAAVGADYRVSPHTVAGFALAGGGTSFGVTGYGSGRSDLFQAGAYLRHIAGPAYLSAALAYGWQDITTDRTVTIAGVDRLRGAFKANAYSGRVEGGYRFVVPGTGDFGVTPYAAAQATAFDLPAYAEQVVSGAANFALGYAGKRVTDTKSELGARSDKSFAVQDGVLTLRSRVAWAHDFNPDRSIAATFQALPGASFVVNGAAPARDSALTTTSAEMTWANGWSATASFESELSAVTRSYAGKGVVRYGW